MDRRAFLKGSAGLAGALALAGCGSTKKVAAPLVGSSDAPADRPTLRLTSGGDQGFPSPFAYMRGGGLIQASFIYDTLMWKDGT